MVRGGALAFKWQLTENMSVDQDNNELSLSPGLLVPWSVSRYCLQYHTHTTGWHSTVQMFCNNNNNNNINNNIGHNMCMEFTGTFELCLCLVWWQYKSIFMISLKHPRSCVKLTRNEHKYFANKDQDPEWPAAFSSWVPPFSAMIKVQCFRILSLIPDTSVVMGCWLYCSCDPLELIIFWIPGKFKCFVCCGSDFYIMYMYVILPLSWGTNSILHASLLRSSS